MEAKKFGTSEELLQTRQHDEQTCQWILGVSTLVQLTSGLPQASHLQIQEHSIYATLY